MNKKKTNKANLENKKIFFVLLGAIISLSVVILIFRIGSKKEIINFAKNAEEIEVEMQFVNVKKKLQKKQESKADEEEHEDLKVIRITENTIKNDTFELDFSIKKTKIENKLPEINIEKFKDRVYFFYDKNPKFKGGKDSLIYFIKKNIKYPQKAIDQDIQGRVYVRFIITKYGNTKNAQVVRSVHPLLDQEAIRIIKLLTDWQPAEYNEKKVSVWYTIPITFIIN